MGKGPLAGLRALDLSMIVAGGLGLGELLPVNPGLVMLRYSGFGQTGPYKDRPGFGAIAECMSGYVGNDRVSVPSSRCCWPTRWLECSGAWPG